MGFFQVSFKSPNSRMFKLHVSFMGKLFDLFCMIFMLFLIHLSNYLLFCISFYHIYFSSLFLFQFLSKFKCFSFAKFVKILANLCPSLHCFIIPCSSNFRIHCICITVFQILFKEMLIPLIHFQRASWSLHYRLSLMLFHSSFLLFHILLVIRNLQQF